MTPDRLGGLAAAVADGLPIAWLALEAETGEDDRPLLRALRGIDAVARVHLERPALAAPTRFRHLEVREKLGEGAAGAVFRAHDPRLDREVALKLVALRDSNGDASAASREGRLLARIRHPNVATVYGADVEDGRVGVWMELVRGRTLAQIVAEDGPRSAREAAMIGLDLARALAAVHAAGVVHRDVKAQNAMREEGGRILLVDFGIGLEAEAAAGDPALRGTPLYLAPEVLAGGAATVRSDVYALGVLLYYLATGEFPVSGATVDDLAIAHAGGVGVRLRDRRPDLPERFVAAVERALDPDPAARPATAGELERILVGVLEPGVAAPSRARWRRRAAAALVLAALSSAAVLWLAPRPAREAERQYQQARALYAAEQTEEAIALLKTATTLDPTHALAFRQLAICQNNLGLFEEALSSASRAYALRDRLAPADAARVAGAYRFGRLQYEEALEAYRQTVLLDPADGESRRQIAHLHAQLGDFPAAVAAARQARDADPASVHNQGLLIVLLAEAGRFDEALAEHAATRDAFPGGHYLHWGEGLARFGLDDLGGGRAAFEALAAGEESYANYARLYLAQGLVLEGRIEDAVHALEAQRGTDARLRFQWSAALRREWLARLEALLGDPSAALAALREVDELPEIPTHLKALRRAAVLRVELGDVDGARRLLERLERLRRAYPSTIAAAAAAHVRGALAVARGDVEAALGDLADARRLAGDLPALLSLAAARAAHGEDAEAARLYGEVLARKGEALRNESASVWVLAGLELARRRRATGDLAGARDAYDRFLARWSDPRLPPVAAARGERAALALPVR